MSIPLNPALQPFAARGDTDGVPLDSLPDMVGDRTTFRIGLNEFGDIAALAVAVRADGFEVQRHQYDGVIMEVWEERTGMDPVLLERWTIRIEQWAMLTRSRQGATLVSGSTGVPVTGELTGGTALIGRSTGNKAMLQTVAWTHASDDMVLRASVFAFQSGVLERRLEPFRNHATRQIIVHRAAATKPAVPAQNEVMYTGTHITTSEGSEWKPISQPLVGATDPQWIASAEFQYQFNSGLWIVPNLGWHVYPGGTTFRVQYASAANGPWVTTAPDTDTLWVRYRLDDGTWSAHQVRGPEGTRVWRTVLDVDLQATQTTSEFMFTEIDTDEYSHIAIVYQGDRDATTAGRQGQRIPLSIPAALVLSGDPAVTDQQETSIFARFVERSGAAYTVGGSIQDLAGWMGEASAAEQRLRVDFYGTTLNDPFISRVVVRRGYTVGTARLKVLAR
ncbi:MAG: hypothetical protein F4Y02_14470 [Chloroflexi bacterium]|nr:hypothetical protein [Chloroflexota bacterium]